MALFKRVVVWVLQILLMIVMVGPGIQKFTAPIWQRMFRAWGYPEHFYLVIGAVEVVCGLGLLVPRIASASAIVLMAVMAGAAVTRLMNGGSGVGELVFFTLLGVVAYVRWPGVLGLLRPAHRPEQPRAVRPV
jgi:uncharacterized membrane protein YphA (DoxX/SURF4 family)